MPPTWRVFLSAPCWGLPMPVWVSVLALGRWSNQLPPQRRVCCRVRLFWAGVYREAPALLPQPGAWRRWRVSVSEFTGPGRRDRWAVLKFAAATAATFWPVYAVVWLLGGF